MKVVGFSFIRNALRYDYPIVEAVKSILPLCDEVILAVGQSEDKTLALVQNIDPKVRIISTVWDESQRQSGRVLALETDKAYDAIPEDADWCFYIQGDEVVHEKYHEPIRRAMLRFQHDAATEGLLFHYRHFYGSYDYVGDSRNWYRKEVRIVRKDSRIRSFRDAQGFKLDERKLHVRQIEAYIHHYGWVKHPLHQQRKQLSFNKWWHDDDWVKTHIPDVPVFDYSQIDSLQRYEDTHPKVMQERIAAMNWQFTFDPTQQQLSWKERLSRAVEKWTGKRVGEYRNYELLK
ncbi:MAG: glycosyltransferase family 2 protein [Bacteroidota bacterium]